MSEFVVHGECSPQFRRVRAAFIENFENRGEVGGAVAIYVDGELVVDLWGGQLVHDQRPVEPWQRHTIVRMMSVNKAMTAICAHRLVDQGLLDYDRRVADYWPEFAQAGKQGITVRMLLAALAGVIYPDGVPDGKVLDWTAMVDGLAKTKPMWEPGTRGAYHSSTYGHLVGELVRRTTGKLPGVYFREEIGDPLNIDCWFSLPQSEFSRVSELLPNPHSTTLDAIAKADTPLARAWRILPSIETFYRDEPKILDREMPSAFGRGNARSVAKVFGALARGGIVDGHRVLSPDAIDAMTTMYWDDNCGLTGRRFRYCMGVYKNMPGRQPMGPNSEAFGHLGAGGSFVFADPAAKLAFSYCTNFMCIGEGCGDRCEALVEAIF